MIGIDPESGAEISGALLLQKRFSRVVTTYVDSRIKNRGFGNRGLMMLGKNQSPNNAMVIQNLTIEALSLPINCLTELEVKQCIASPRDDGFTITIIAAWQGETLTLTSRL